MYITYTLYMRYVYRLYAPCITSITVDIYIYTVFTLGTHYILDVYYNHVIHYLCTICTLHMPEIETKSMDYRYQSLRNLCNFR